MEYYFEEGCYIDEWSNTPADPACSIARVRLPGKGQTRWHKIAHTMERYVILQGEGVVEIGAEPPRHVIVGDVVLIAPSQMQRIFNPSNEDLLFLAICTPRFEVANYSNGD